jgi:hypothetical protein
MAVQVADRRCDRRLTSLPAEEWQATLRPGRHVVVIDLSPSGVQIETERQLRPGTRVHVRLTTDAWTHAAAAWVLRCGVWLLEPSRGVVYRGALRFETRCELPPAVAALSDLEYACLKRPDRHPGASLGDERHGLIGAASFGE